MNNSEWEFEVIILVSVAASEQNEPIKLPPVCASALLQGSAREFQTVFNFESWALSHDTQLLSWRQVRVRRGVAFRPCREVRSAPAEM